MNRPITLLFSLPPAGSVFVVFGSHAEATMPDVLPGEASRLAERMGIKGTWQVSFPPDRGAPPSYILKKTRFLDRDP